MGAIEKHLQGLVASLNEEQANEVIDRIEPILLEIRDGVNRLVAAKFPTPEKELTRQQVAERTGFAYDTIVKLSNDELPRVPGSKSPVMFYQKDVDVWAEHMKAEGRGRRAKRNGKAITT